MKINPYMKGLGFKRDLPDIRDFTLESNGNSKLKTFPSWVDLRPHYDMPPIYDQETLGSCTAQSVGAICDFEIGKDTPYSPSKLFLYYVTRSLEGTIEIDAGATIRNTIKATNEFGVAREETWPYLIQKYKDTPFKGVFNEALNYQALQYKKVRQRLEDIKECLYSENLIAFGFGVYDSLYKVTDINPILQLPSPQDTLLGGHAVVLVGYDDRAEYFIVRNSWSDSWAINGYFYMPYEYVLNQMLSMDFWTVSLVERNL